MSHRTKVSSVVMWSMVLLGVVSGGQAGEADDTTDALDLQFADVEVWATERSPRSQALGLRLDSVEARRREALTWSNPAVAYDHEESDSAREWQLTLHKRISRPFTRGALADAWDNRVQAEELDREFGLALLTAELKTGYVRLRLLEDHLQRIGDLSSLVDLAAETANHREAEGELSGLGRQLIHLAAYSLEAEEIRLRSRYRRLLADWRTDMGIPAAQAIDLTTPVDFRAADPDLLTGLETRLDTSADNRAGLALAASLDRQAAAARPGLVPGIDIYGGYKSFTDDLDGFVAGVAVDLPLFDRGTDAADALQAQRRLVQSERSAELSRRRAEVAALASSIQEAQPLLERTGEHFADGVLVDTLLLSYREGAITLDELLGAVQVASAAVAGFHASLADYYADIFRLEALTGAKVVHFAP